MPRTSEAWTRALAAARCSELGYVLVEASWYDARTRRRHDIGGMADGLALPAHDARPAILVQYTSWTNARARARKIQDNPHLARCLRAGLEVVVWGFDRAKLRMREFRWGEPLHPPVETVYAGAISRQEVT